MFLCTTSRCASFVSCLFLWLTFFFGRSVAFQNPAPFIRTVKSRYGSSSEHNAVSYLPRVVLEMASTNEAYNLDTTVESNKRDRKKTKKESNSVTKSEPEVIEASAPPPVENDKRDRKKKKEKTVTKADPPEVPQEVTPQASTSSETPKGNTRKPRKGKPITNEYNSSPPPVASEQKPTLPTEQVQKKIPSSSKKSSPLTGGVVGGAGILGVAGLGLVNTRAQLMESKGTRVISETSPRPQKNFQSLASVVSFNSPRSQGTRAVPQRRKLKPATVSKPPQGTRAIPQKRNTKSPGGGGGKPAKPTNKRVQQPPSKQRGTKSPIGTFAIKQKKTNLPKGLGDSSKQGSTSSSSTIGAGLAAVALSIAVVMTNGNPKANMVSNAASSSTEPTSALLTTKKSTIPKESTRNAKKEKEPATAKTPKESTRKAKKKEETVKAVVPLGTIQESATKVQQEQTQSPPQEPAASGPSENEAKANPPDEAAAPSVEANIVAPVKDLQAPPTDDKVPTEFSSQANAPKNLVVNPGEKTALNLGVGVLLVSGLYNEKEKQVRMTNSWMGREDPDQSDDQVPLVKTSLQESKDGAVEKSHDNDAKMQESEEEGTEDKDDKEKETDDDEGKKESADDKDDKEKETDDDEGKKESADDKNDKETDADDDKKDSADDKDDKEKGKDA